LLSPHWVGSVVSLFWKILFSHMAYLRDKYTLRRIGKCAKLPKDHYSDFFFFFCE
jgi:hypothetical protein